MPAAPTVAIVGRPNVGKSTLFNRLVGQRKSIVHDQPGVTRDRLTGRWTLPGDRPVELIDTGGLVEDPSATGQEARGEVAVGLNEQVFLAMDESDLLLLVIDAKEGLVSGDLAVVAEVRRRGARVVVIANKGDTRAAIEGHGELWSLGFEDLILVSAEHGSGMADLEELVARRLEEIGALSPGGEEDDGDGIPGIAIVGRPNVGKSSLVNRLLGQERVLVSPVAGTTRDPVDTVLEAEGRKWRLVDTAGIRRRAKVSGAAEELAVLFARRSMDRAEVVVLVVDATEGVTTLDLAIAGDAWDRGRGLVVALNKWDLLDERKREKLEESWEKLAEIASKPERVNVSALTGRRVDRLFGAVERTLERLRTSLSTGEVNRLFEEALRRHQPPQIQGRPWKVYYATQVKASPPTFMLFANRKIPRSDPYRRYLENRIREACDLVGVPVRLVIRKRGG